jgi:hypothetical protein
VALLTLEHQVGVANRINAIKYQYDRFKADGLTDADWKVLDREIEDLVGYMLFVDEAPLSEPVEGTSTFMQTFPERGPRDSKGRSLRDFDLRTRLFRHPLSYMVYSPLFDRMPAPLLQRTYRRLHEVLVLGDTTGQFRSLLRADRGAVLEILLETKPNLPAEWSQPRFR